MANNVQKAVGLSATDGESAVLKCCLADRGSAVQATTHHRDPAWTRTGPSWGPAVATSGVI